MSTQEDHPNPTDAARRYIEDVMKINSQFGMGSTASDDNHSAAVSAAAAAYQWLNRVSGAQEHSQ